MRVPRRFVLGDASVKMRGSRSGCHLLGRSGSGTAVTPPEQSLFNGRSKKGDEMFISNERNDKALNIDNVITLTICSDEDGRYYLRALAKHDSITIMSGNAEEVRAGYGKLMERLNSRQRVVVDRV